mmetsp:Transcript_18058/g.27350  ORF Transcript_18058/g.27350 Transcript_18058/m.27350 type:complete len:2567 (+) Transcript_18058:258-7958(+)
MPKPSYSIESAESAPPLTAYQRSDLTDLVGEEALEGRPYFSEARRSNLHIEAREPTQQIDLEYEVKTSVIVQTSRGTTSMSLNASSIRANDYRVPERIRFHAARQSKRKFKSSDATFLQSIDRAPLAKERTKWPFSDCYDLHIFNPRNESLEILEVLVSKPDSVSMFNVENDTYMKNSSNTFSDWGGAEKVVKPRALDYVITVCPNKITNPLNLIEKSPPDKEEAKDLSRLDINLGYLQVKTEQDTLFVLLEWYLTMKELNEVVTKETDSLATIKERQDDRIKGKPKELKTFLVAHASPESRMKLSIQNTAAVPIKIMRISLLLDKGKSASLEETKLQLRVQNNLIDNACSSGTLSARDDAKKNIRCEDQGVLGVGEISKEAIYLDIEFDSQSTTNFLRKNGGVNKITGVVLVTATTNIDDSFDVWFHSMKRNPYSRNKVVLEVPWSIEMVDGKIHAVIHSSSMPSKHLRHEVPFSIGNDEINALFFPFEPLDRRKWNDWPGVTGRLYDYDSNIMSNTIRFVSLSRATLNVTKVVLERDMSDPHSNICDRFRITSIGRQTVEHLDNTFDLGSILIEYSFEPYFEEYRRRHGKGNIADIIYPTICKLTYETWPVDTGKHSISLIVFSGRLETTTTADVRGRFNSVTDFAFYQGQDTTTMPASLMLGFSQANRWLESSKMGFALVQYLRKHVRRGKSWSDFNLFRNYMLKLANVTADGVKNREGFVEPILIHAGAITHGETLTMPLHFTNHNPVPVQIFLDVAEVEGMRISISRETSRLRGDGNSIIDYLPGSINAKVDRLDNGVWATHSREGLKHFLMSNSHASQFFQFLQHRDAIDVSVRATKRLPLLGAIYKKRAKAQFHGDKHSLNFYSEKMPGCDGDEKKPSDYLHINASSESRFGPILLSEDLNIAHGNTICDPQLQVFAKSQTNGRSMMHLKHVPVTIPPGGVARFDVKIRAPDRNSLNKDVTPFLSTGLVLSTDHGQIMPVIVTFEALLGQLKLFRSPTSIGTRRSWQFGDGFDHQFGGEVVEVPLRLFPDNLPSRTKNNYTGITILPSPDMPNPANFTSWMYPTGASSIPIFLGSSFSSNITLRGIKSCNPWFYVELKENQDFSPDLNNATNGQNVVEIGNLLTAVTCPKMHQLFETQDNNTLYPSFYQCALEWLENRTMLQSHGCGVQPMPKSLEDVDFGAEDDATKRAVDALQNAIKFSLIKYGNEEGQYQVSGDSSKKDYKTMPYKSGAVRGSGFVDHSTLDIFSEITDAWRTISELDLHSITSSFKATVDYSPSNGKRNQERTLSATENEQSLTVSMRDVALRTKLSMPHLVKPKSNYLYKDRNDSEDDFFSFLEFPPTTVADVVAMEVPIKNPTGVPVKVKLATVSREKIERETRESNSFDILVSDEVRQKYLHQFESVYTQTGADTAAQSPGHSWWEGHGSFYQSDDQGHLVQSRHNITIKSGSGGRSHVSMLNPSLYSQSSFTVGCGARCGLREETGGNKIEAGFRMTSTIGAAAAAGASLVGRPRSIEEQQQFGEDEPTLSAGGTTFVDAAPAAFAVPYSAFDEVIIPPYGEATLGPILFRPTGRYGLMGCDTILDNDAIPWGEKAAESCSSTIFQSMVLLENSLTGLERLLLRGKGMWESVVFLDPLGSDSFDAYGDLEIRNGHSTLVFPGSCVSSHHAGLSAHPVIKGVMVQNDGDLDVEFSRVFLLDSSRVSTKNHEKIRPSRGCFYRGFRLLECSETNGPSFRPPKTGSEATNIYHGFRIPAGSNKTIFIEHHPSCTFRSDFVVINFEFKKRVPDFPEDSSSHVFISSDGVQLKRTNDFASALKRRNLELQVGFDMSLAELRSCIPIQSAHSDPVYISGSQNISSWNKKNNISPEEFSSLQRSVSIGGALRHHLHGVVSPAYLSFGLISWSCSVCMAAMLALLIGILVVSRLNFSKDFKSKIKGSRIRHHDSSDATKDQEGFVTQSSWPSTFRCLARFDPTSSELQTIGREQTRQIFLHRVKTLGALSPQCIDSTGAFNREGGGWNQRNGTTSNGKMQTLSESLFRGCQLNASDKVNSWLMPCGLCWRTAAARGLIKEKHTSLELRSDAVLFARELAREKEGDLCHDSSLKKHEAIRVNPTEAGKQVDLVKSVDKPSSELVSPSPSDSEEGWHLAAVHTSSSSGRAKESVLENKIDKSPDFIAKKQRKPRNKIAEKVPAATGNKPSRNKTAKSPLLTRGKSDDTNSTESSPLVAVKNQNQQRRKTSATAPETAKKEHTALTRKNTKQNGKMKTRRSKRTGDAASPGSQKLSGSKPTKKTGKAELAFLKSKSATETKTARPPPGIAPPPGFSGSNTADSALDEVPNLRGTLLEDSQANAGSQELLSLLPPLDSPTETRREPTKTNAETALTQLLSATSPSASNNGNSLFETIRSTDEQRLEVSNSRVLRNDSSSSIAERGGYGSPDGGFDVMGFLDNLLDESELNIDSEEIEKPALKEKNETSWSISSDPWAQSGRSRAAAYGINVETEDNTEDDNSIVQAMIAPSSHAVDPLLTEAALVNEDSQAIETDNNSQEYDDEDFYSKLLGE